MRSPNTADRHLCIHARYHERALSRAGKRGLAPWLMAAAALVAGIAVYLLARDWTTVYLLQDFARFGPATAGPGLGPFGGSLPSFTHAFAFSLITVLVLPPAASNATRACAGWALVDGVFEIGQLPALAQLLCNTASGWAGIPLLENVGPYFERGRFDGLDLVAIALGCGCAWLIGARASNRAASAAGTTEKSQ